MVQQLAVDLDATVPEPQLQPVEYLVAEAWRRTLCKRPSDRAAANVFGMRIGSRPIYRFLTEIERSTGVSLPFTALLQAPTIDAFTKLVRAGRAPAFEPLIPFKLGVGSTPLFILPGIGGSVFQLFDLARLIRYPGTIYLNQQAGLDGEHEPHTTIADMVAFQVAAIRRRQPQGPYMLLGYSLGSLLVLEVARCLIERGESVPFIGMIEPGLPEPVWPVRVRLEFLVSRLKHHWSQLGGLAPRQAAAYVAARTRPLLGRLGRMLGTQAVGRSAYQNEKLSSDLTALIETSSRAYYRYRPRKFSQKVVLFQSELGDPLDCDPLRIWPRHLEKFEIRMLPGDHKTVLRGENVRALAAEVSKCLEAGLSSEGVPKAASDGA